MFAKLDRICTAVPPCLVEAQQRRGVLVERKLGVAKANLVLAVHPELELRRLATQLAIPCGPELYQKQDAANNSTLASTLGHWQERLDIK